ncbi:excalibur calcium-binding domain-containing protein [Pseudoalteromonas agarivorans]
MLFTHGEINIDTHSKFFINNCPNTKMDGDGDGKPCENVSRFKTEW